jgi:hypothetical protein
VAGPLLCFGQKKTREAMSDSDKEGLQDNADVPPAPDLSDQAEGEASDLQDEEAAKPKRKNRVWELLGRWDPTTVDAEVIDNEIERIAQAKITEGGINSLLSRKRKETDLGGWKHKDIFVNPSTGFTVNRYRCPLSVRFKCQALLKTVRTEAAVELYMSEMHSVDAHVPAKDTGKYLKFHQMEVIQTHVKVNPTISAAHLRRNIHRTSPEKKIAPEHAR